MPNTTHLILHKVLVTNVQVSEAVQKSDDDDVPDTAPAGSLLVTLALDAESVQRVVFTAEHGMLWLSAEPTNAPEGELIIETRGSVDR
jgi:pilus assembly protein CpaB